MNLGPYRGPDSCLPAARRFTRVWNPTGVQTMLPAKCQTRHTSLGPYRDSCPPIARRFTRLLQPYRGPECIDRGDTELSEGFQRICFRFHELGKDLTWGKGGEQ
eukprot:6294605-Amphidinium_carterae.1